MECHICSLEVSSKGFGSHLKNHNITKEEYYLKYISSDNICKNENCNNLTKLLSISKGFQTYCSSKCSNSSFKVKLKNSIAHKGKSKNDIKGDLNPAKRKSVRLKISNKLKGNQHTLGRNFSEDEKQKISERVTEYWKNNPGKKLNIKPYNKNYKSGYFYSKK